VDDEPLFVLVGWVEVLVVVEDVLAVLAPEEDDVDMLEMEVLEMEVVLDVAEELDVVEALEVAALTESEKVPVLPLLSPSPE